MLPAKFGSIWPSSFRGDFFNRLNKSSPLKLLGQMEPNLAGSIYVRYSIKLLHMVPFGQQTFNSSQSEKRIALGGHVYWPNGTK
jgi:hypothetical protein